MMKVAWSAIACQCVAAKCHSSPHFSKDHWPHCQQVGDAFFYNGLVGDDVLLGLEFSSATRQGWSGVALSGNGGMKGADTVVVRVKDGEWVVEDGFSPDYVTPQMDSQQDARLLFVNEEGGRTSWGVARPKSTCDDNDYPIEDHSMFLLWAFGNTHDFHYHGFQSRGGFHANLISGPGDVEPWDPTDPTFDLTFDKAELTTNANPYICTSYSLAALTRPGLNFSTGVDVTRFDVVLDKPEYPHHMLLYSCKGYKMDENEKKHGEWRVCGGLMPDGCSELVSAWAVGAEPIIMPRDVGRRLGGGSKFDWLVLETHYYNPKQETGIIDSSGLRLTASKSLRKYTSGTFMASTGSEDRLKMPSGQTDFSVPNIIPKECTEHWTDDIHVIGTGHHAHLIAKTMEVFINRGDETLGLLRREKRYDFNHQSIEEGPVKLIKPGDQMYLKCTYDTTSTLGGVGFGDATGEEMCNFVMFYWPAQEQCTASRYLRPDKYNVSGEWEMTGGKNLENRILIYKSFPLTPEVCIPTDALNERRVVQLKAAIGVDKTTTQNTITGDGITKPSTSSTATQKTITKPSTSSTATQKTITKPSTSSTATQNTIKTPSTNSIVMQKTIAGDGIKKPSTSSTIEGDEDETSAAIFGLSIPVCSAIAVLLIL